MNRYITYNILNKETYIVENGVSNIHIPAKFLNNNNPTVVRAVRNFNTQPLIIRICHNYCKNVS